MTRQDAVDDFLSQKTLALVGASRSGKKFGNAILKELKAKGYEVLPVHPEAKEIQGTPCFASLAVLPKPVGGVVLVVPPRQAETLIEEAVKAGIPRVWLQQGSSSPEVLALCARKGLTVIHGECILMFAQPAGGVHRFHHWLWGVLGKLPTKSESTPRGGVAS